MKECGVLPSHDENFPPMTLDTHYSTTKIGIVVYEQQLSACTYDWYIHIFRRICMHDRVLMSGFW